MSKDSMLSRAKEFTNSILVKEAAIYIGSIRNEKQKEYAQSIIELIETIQETGEKGRLRILGLLENAYTDIYTVECDNGSRYASLAEIKEAIPELKILRRWKVDEITYRALCLMIFVIRKGDNKDRIWCRRAGLKSEYTNGAVTSNIFEDIGKDTELIGEVKRLCDSRYKYSVLRNEIKKLRAEGTEVGYVNHIRGEKLPLRSIKQIAMGVLMTFPRGSNKQYIRSCIHVAVKIKTGIHTTTEELIQLREGYNKYLLDDKEEERGQGEIIGLREACYAVRNWQKSGTAVSDSFLDGLVEYAENREYKVFSDKQAYWLKRKAREYNIDLEHGGETVTEQASTVEDRVKSMGESIIRAMQDPALLFD